MAPSVSCNPARFGVRPLLGAALEVDIVLLAKTLRGWSNLCRLCSLAHRDQPKGEARTTLATAAQHRGDLFYLTATRNEARLRTQEALGRDAVFLELRNHLRAEDPWLLEVQAELGARCQTPTVVTNDVRYHGRDRRSLHDVLTAISNRATLEEIHAQLPANSEQVLKAGDELRPLFRGHEDALARTAELAQDAVFRSSTSTGSASPATRCRRARPPSAFLYQLCQQGARQRYHPITPTVARRLQKELDVIEKTGLAEFFLINWNLMRFASENGVPGQGRGSAADSIVAYVLGITRVDPIEHNLLFERFLHEEMTTMPDIDIDFSTAHREKVIQYIYEKYGWERTGMVCNLVTFKPRMAIRQVGKALGFPPDLLDRLAKGVDRWFEEDLEATVSAAQAPDARVNSRLWQQFMRLVREVQGFPRHLSIHVGGMLVTGEPLVDIVPVEPGGHARPRGRPVR